MKKTIHYAILVAIVLMAAGAWGRSLYHTFKYSKELAPEATSLEAIMANVTKNSLESELMKDDESEVVDENLTTENEDETETVLEKIDDVSVVETGKSEVNSVATLGQVEIVEPEKEAELPAKLNIAMPFHSQAPHANWNLPYQEACEEASVLLVANLFKKMEWDKDEFDQEILKIVEWEKRHFGDYFHTDAEQTRRMIGEYLGMQAVIHEDPSFEDIQKIISQGHLIVAPFAGKLLKNPNYTNGGPIYHMMVIKGYDAEKKQIVTHDVGTRRGEDYVYSWERIQESLHDWHDSDISLGKAKIIEVFPR